MAGTDPENRLIGYARVSTYGQTLDTQLDQLRAAGCSNRNIYREKATGARGSSPSAGARRWALATTLSQIGARACHQTSTRFAPTGFETAQPRRSRLTPL